MRKFCVYKHTSPSGKVYIGITQQNPEQRWRGGNGYRRNAYFFRAIKKYGWDNFGHEILHEGLTKEEACATEIALIEAYHSNDKAFGYNHTSGGETFKHSPDSIRKMIANRKGKTISEHTRALMRANHAGGAAPKPVICLTTGKIYASINAASRDTGIHKSPISSCCRGVKHHNTAGGLRWAYYRENQQGEKDGTF